MERERKRELRLMCEYRQMNLQNGTSASSGWHVTVVLPGSLLLRHDPGGPVSLQRQPFGSYCIFERMDRSSPLCMIPT